jgi:4-amino-4-deoxy-L-arabinose transferase-like glycosyltransferase
MLFRLPRSERGATLLVLGFGALMFLPRLGAVGLWDPWETHYAEVAREMIARRDYVFPHWSSAYFFSKPVLTLWLIALGLLLVGAEPGQAALPLGPYTEWGVRLPFALLAILTLWAVYRVGCFLAGGERRVGLSAAFILGTSPQFVFIGKQAITDLPMLALTWAGLAFFLPAAFDDPAADASDPAPGPRVPLGPAGRALRLTAAGLLVLVMTGQLALLFGALPDARWALAGAELAALLVAAAVLSGALPAGVVLASTLFGLAALAKGLEVGALVGPPLVAALLLGGDLRADLRRFGRARPIAALLVFLLVAAPWYLALSSFSGRDDEGLTFVSRFFGHDHFARIASGVHGDRGGAGYYAEQLLYGFFPWSAVLPLAILGASRGASAKGAFRFVLVYALWVYAFFTASATKLHHYVFPALPGLALLVALFGASIARAPRRAASQLLAPGAALAAIAIYAVALRDLVDEPRNLVNLFTYKYDRGYPRELVVRPFLAAIAGGGGLWACLALAKKSTARAGQALATTALALALWLSHYHFNMLSPHWSQAHLFATYFAERRPGEPLLAYQLNWRGENFYSRGEVVEVMNSGAAERLRELVSRPGKTFILIESTRFSELRAALPPASRERLEILDRSNEHFYLCVVGEA